MSRILFLTHAKAGSQWITNVLSDHRVLACVPHIRFKRQSEVQYDWADYFRDVENVLIAPVFGASHFIWTTFRSANDRAIRVGRDPRDAVVSWVYSATFSHVSEPTNSLVRAPLLALDMRHRIMLGIDRKVSGNADQLRAWNKAGESSICYVTTYERIIDNQQREFAAIFDFLGWPIPDDVLREVIETHSFETRSGGRARGQVDPFSHYRLGLAGDWRNHFDRDLARQFEQAFPHLLVDLGYEDSDTWWESVPDQVLAVSEDRIRDLSEAMAGALEERDRRWATQQPAMERRAAMLEREIETLRMACDERLALIQDQQRHLAERLAALREQDDEMRRLRSDAANLMVICNERLAVIEEQARAIEHLRAAGKT